MALVEFCCDAYRLVSGRTVMEKVESSSLLRQWCQNSGGCYHCDQAEFDFLADEGVDFLAAASTAMCLSMVNPLGLMMFLLVLEVRMSILRRGFGGERFGRFGRSGSDGEGEQRKPKTVSKKGANRGMELILAFASVLNAATTGAIFLNGIALANRVGSLLAVR